MSTVQILNGFRIPYSRYRGLPAEMARVLPAALAPYARMKVAELRGDLADGEAESARPFIEKVIAPRGYAPSNFVRYRLEAGNVLDTEFAVSVLADYAPYFLHPHQVWSSSDLTIRVDLWMTTADAEGPDADYVYGRIVCAAADETYIALLGIDGVEEFSYFDQEDGTERWKARAGVWETIVDEDSLTQWTFVPQDIWLHSVVEGG